MLLANRTDDPTIGRVCREFIRALDVELCDLVEFPADRAGCDADIEIRHFRLSGTRAAADDNAGRPFLICLVERNEIDCFLSDAPRGAWPILKPVSARVLIATLHHAMEVAKRGVEARSSRAPAAAQGPSARGYLDLQLHDQERTRFLARTTHDMKAPLSVIDGYCRLLLNGEVGKFGTRQRNAIMRMQKSIARLNRMAQDLFDITARIGIDDPRAMQVGNVTEVVAESACDVAAIVKERRIHIARRLEPCPEPVAFDRTGIERVLMNLFENAYRFTPTNGSIRVNGYPFFLERRHYRSAAPAHSDNRSRDSRLPNSYRVDVHNTGPGVDEEHLPYIFEEYTSFDQSSNGHSAGLGLATCRLIITRHGGRIWAENTHDGPVFSFVIPYLRHEGRVKRTTADDQLKAATAYIGG